ncbi:hypothetical protein OG871_30300 [Kitasatospora sp. NBC_00374]|uniref:hypothetical protein n=1 Tax=Kitasatospora sp. NBC_00374 TaxID=2975964 RepID=UPI0030E5D646
MPHSQPAREQLTDHDAVNFQTLIARLNASLAADRAAVAGGADESSKMTVDTSQ